VFAYRSRSQALGSRLFAIINPFGSVESAREFASSDDGGGHSMISFLESSGVWGRSRTWKEESAFSDSAAVRFNLFQERLQEPTDILPYIPMQEMLEGFVNDRAHREPLEQVVINFWLNGGGGVTTQLHYDHRDNLLLQIRGTKSFVLFPPSQTPYMYACTENCSSSLFDAKSIGHHVSTVNFLQIEKYPLLADADGFHGELHEGDVLLIPKLWWHLITSHGEPNLMVNVWFGPARYDHEQR